MLFSTRDARRILAGRKHQHRLGPGQRPPGLGRLAISAQEPNPNLGFDASGRPKLETRLVCHVEVTEIRRLDLLTMTEADARAEGFGSLGAFREEWVQRYGAWPGPLVHVLSLDLDRSARPRFLSERVVAGSQGDYVYNPARALRGELEAVDAETLDRFAAEARARHRGLSADASASMTLDEQVAELRALAAARGRCIRSELRKLRRVGPTPEALDSLRERLAA